MGSKQRIFVGTWPAMSAAKYRREYLGVSASGLARTWQAMSLRTQNPLRALLLRQLRNGFGETGMAGMESQGFLPRIARFFEILAMFGVSARFPKSGEARG